LDYQWKPDMLQTAMQHAISSIDDPAYGDDVRERILAATAEIIAQKGRDAATTRAVATAAGVQAPTIYRLFGDKDGLLEAVVEHGLKEYVAQKSSRTPHDDPVDELRAGWDLHVAFGLSHPGLFVIMSGNPRPSPMSPALHTAMGILRQKIRNIAVAGRLRVTEDRAVTLLHAAGTGTVFALLTQPEAQRDLGLSALARDSIIAAITSDPVIAPGQGVASAAVAMNALLEQTAVLSDGERHLMTEWLTRIAT
jgi:AcrR family transcriptional regulator